MSKRGAWIRYIWLYISDIFTKKNKKWNEIKISAKQPVRGSERTGFVHWDNKFPSEFGQGNFTQSFRLSEYLLEKKLV